MTPIAIILISFGTDQWTKYYFIAVLFTANDFT